MAYEVIVNISLQCRILLEPRVEGVYVNIFSPQYIPGDDSLQPSLEVAMEACKQRYGISSESWRIVPNEPIHFDSTEDQVPQFSFAISDDGMPIMPSGDKP